MDMWIVWLIVMVLGVIIEAIGPGLVSIWFSAGALIALAISFIPGCEWWIQLIVFAVVTTICCLALRPFMKKFVKKDTISSNSDALIGEIGITLEEITDTKPGEMKISGAIWHALSSKEGETIEANSKVKVIRITGNKLIVEKVEKEGEQQ